MMSYSKVFKATHLSVVGEVKILAQPLIPLETQEDQKESLALEQAENLRLRQEADERIQRAREQAQEIIEHAEQQAQALQASAEQTINQWWEENQRKLDERLIEAEQKGYQDGFQNGKEEGLTQIRREYETQIQQAHDVLMQAYEQKESIIAEAEPFLLELSTVIASQIVKQELANNPDKFISLIKQHIQRVKEKDSITICVHPDDFTFIQDHRAHFLAMVHGETEIKIIPDYSVSLKGCVIRTAYGSIDARIDTQLEEIKKVLLGAREEPEHVVRG